MKYVIGDNIKIENFCQHKYVIIVINNIARRVIKLISCDEVNICLPDPIKKKENHRRN